MHRPTLYSLPVWLSLVLLAPACGSDNSTPAPGPSPTEITETFGGIVTINGAITHFFRVERTGTVTARLEAVEPDVTATIGMSLGTWNGSACQIIIANDLATQGATVTGTAAIIGDFCVRAHDVGRLAAPTSYQIVVRYLK